MEESTRRLTKLILWEIVLLFVLALIFAYAPRFVEMQSLGDVLEEFLEPALTILIVLVITKLFLTIMQPIFKRTLLRYLSSYYDVEHTWKFISYVVWIIAFVILAFLLAGNIITTSVFVGLLVLLMVLISHRAIANFSGWLYIIFNSPVKRGDIIEVNGIKGKIAEVSTMNVILEEMEEGRQAASETGRRVTIPNSFVFSQPVFSLETKDSLVWDEIRVLLSGDANHTLAEDIMTQVATSIVGPTMKKRRQDMLKKATTPGDVPSIPTTRVSLEPEGVLLVLRYFCPLADRSEIRSAISENIITEFKKEDIELTFRQREG